MTFPDGAGAWWRLLVWRPVRAYPGGYGAMVLALAIGVAMMVAVELINSAALVRFDAGVQRLTGGVDLQVVPRMGTLRDADLATLRQLPGVRYAGPVLRGRIAVVAATGDRPVEWLALDLLADGWMRPGSSPHGVLSAAPETLFNRGGVFLGAALARQLGVAVGDHLASAAGGRAVPLTVVGVLPQGPADRLLVLDVATAQWTFNRLGELDRIDLVLERDAARQGLERRIEQVLDGRGAVTGTRLDSRRLEAMTRAYRINLRILSGIGLLTAGFLIWSLLELGLRRRYAEFQLLRRLGFGDDQLLYSLAGTALLVAVPGLALGVAAGYFVARLAVAWTGGDLGAGYFAAASGVPLSLQSLGGPLAVASLALVIVWIQPVARTLRASAGGFAVSSRQARSRSTPMLWVGLLVLSGAAVGLVRLPPLADIPVGGYGAIAAVLGVALMLVPLLIQTVLRNFELRPGRLASGLVLARLRAAPGRAGLAAGAALVSFALMVAMSGMVWSFRGSVESWLDQVLRADLFVSSGPVDAADFITATEVAGLRALPGVAMVETLRDVRVLWPGSPVDDPPVMLSGRDLEMSGVRRMLGLTTAAPFSGGCVVSEAFAARFAVAVGDLLTLPPLTSAEQCRILGVWRDYGYQWGRVVLARPQLQRLTGITGFNAVAISATPDTDAAALRDLVARQFGQRPGIAITDQLTLRREALKEFDRTFAVTYVLVVIAVGVGVLAVVNAQLLQIEQRRAELSVLTHLGWGGRELRRLLAGEAGALALLGVVGGALSGLVCTLILNRVINVQSFHWTIDTRIPWGMLSVAGSLLVVCAAVGGALVASRRSETTASVTLEEG